MDRTGRYVKLHSTSNDSVWELTNGDAMFKTRAGEWGGYSIYDFNSWLTSHGPVLLDKPHIINEFYDTN